MSEQRVLNPVHSPDQAAHEVVLELCRSGAFGLGPEADAMGTGDGQALGEAVSAAHQALAEYYRTLRTR